MSMQLILFALLEIGIYLFLKLVELKYYFITLDKFNILFTKLHLIKKNI